MNNHMKESFEHNSVYADITVRVRRNFQPAVRGALHAAQCNGFGRDPGRTVAGASRARPAPQLARPRALRVR